MTQQNLSISSHDALAMLRWYQDIGVTGALADEVTDMRAAGFPSASEFLSPAPKMTQAVPAEQAGNAGAQSAQQDMPTSSVVPQTGSITDHIQSTPPPTPANTTEPLGTAEASLDARRLAAEATNLEELKQAVTDFEGCVSKRTAENLVFSDGNPKAKIMFISEAPMAEDDRTGKSFSGPNGELLNRMLAAIGLDRETVYLSNIVNWRPPGNRTASQSEITVCLPFIQKHIELVAPDILICVGGGAAQALFETRQGITRLRGKWMTYKSEGLEKEMPAMAIFHPDYLSKSPAQKALAWKDLCAIKARLSETSTTDT